MIKHIITLGIITCFMVGAVVYGFLNGGSPWEARKQKLDQTRIGDLTEIKYGIESYRSQNKSLPKNLSDIKGKLYGAKSIADPETGQEYEYKVVNDSAYQLCATFGTDPPQNSLYGSSVRALNLENQISTYAKGHYCFDLKTFDSSYTSPSSNTNVAVSNSPQDDPNNKPSDITSTKVSEDTVIVSRNNSFATKNSDYITSHEYSTDVVCPDNYAVASTSCVIPDSSRTDVSLIQFQPNSHSPTQSGVFCAYKADKNFTSTISATCKLNYYTVYKQPDELKAEVAPLAYNRFELWTSQMTTAVNAYSQTISVHCPSGYKAVSVVGCGIDNSVAPPAVKFMSSETQATMGACVFQAEKTFKSTIRMICEKTA